MKAPVIAIALVLLLGSAQAAVIDLPLHFSLQNTELQTTFTITNETNEPQDVSFEMYAPFQYRILEGPDVVGSNDSVQYTIAFFPEGDFIGTTYQTKAVVTVGDEVTEIPITIDFKQGEACNIETTTNAIYTTDEEDLQIDVLLNIDNLNGSDVNISNFRISGIPYGWKAELPESIAVNAYSATQTKLHLVPLTQYTGEGKVQFSCDGVEKEAIVEFQSEDEFSLGDLTGLFALPEGWEENELLINVLLFIIAVLLLSTFISRYTKRYAEQKYEQEKVRK